MAACQHVAYDDKASHKALHRHHGTTKKLCCSISIFTKPFSQTPQDRCVLAQCQIRCYPAPVLRVYDVSSSRTAAAHPNTGRHGEQQTLSALQTRSAKSYRPPNRVGCHAVVHRTSQLTACHSEHPLARYVWMPLRARPCGSEFPGHHCHNRQCHNHQWCHHKLPPQNSSRSAFQRMFFYNI